MQVIAPTTVWSSSSSTCSTAHPHQHASSSEQAAGAPRLSAAASDGGCGPVEWRERVRLAHESMLLLKALLASPGELGEERHLSVCVVALCYYDLMPAYSTQCCNT